MTRVVSVVLAAGRGERMGGPKALLLWPDGHGGEAPLAAVHARARLAAESARVLVVVRADVAAILAPALPERAEVVISSRADDEGPAGSLAAAAPSLEERDLVVVTPVDVPPVRDATVRALVDAASRSDALAARPVFEGRGGHPVVVRASALAAYRDASSPPPLRDVLRAMGERCVAVAAEDAGIRADLDRAEDLSGFARFFGAESGRDPEKTE